MTDKKAGTAIIKFESVQDIKAVLAGTYQKQIENFMGDQKKALKFLSAVVSDVQRNPKIIECTPVSVINSYMTMAQLGLEPSGVSGEAYVIPYDNSKKEGDRWVKVKEAQFQLGYQGLVTLFYRAGVSKIISDIVRENDEYALIDGELTHKIDLTKSMAERGNPIGAYVKITYRGSVMSKFMNAKDILDHGKRFSKSYDEGGKYSPWNPSNDPELWMWKKTVLKQASKLIPKNETIARAIAVDNEDSRISDAIKMRDEGHGLSMGNFLKAPNDQHDETENSEEGRSQKDEASANAEGTQA